MSRPNSKGIQTALLVCLDFGHPDFDEDVAEGVELVSSAQMKVLQTLTAKRERPDAALFAGKGKVEEIAALVEALGVDTVVFNHALSPVQERNLTNALNCEVVDRTRLILVIFAQRARSHEGKLQVELAQLTYLSTRLVGGSTHLDRQQGSGSGQGGGGMRGPGEKQLETDRRLIDDRRKLLKSRLATLKKQRDTQRKSRDRNKTFSVSLVGYTNAGKSTLFNALSKAGVYAADQLFATLDTTSRRVFLHHDCTIIMSDTVGFIRNLPHALVAAFRATLDEATQADVLLHIVDAASPVRDQQIEEVNRVLHEIGADKLPQCLIWNKIDVLDLPAGADAAADGTIEKINLSAKTGAGLDVLRTALAAWAGKPAVDYLANWHEEIPPLKPVAANLELTGQAPSAEIEVDYPQTTSSIFKPYSST
jgi:GTP-binding protein HflX